MSVARAALLVCALLLVACARDSEVRILSEADLPQDLYTRPAPAGTSAPTREMTVYLTRAGRLWPAPRVVSASVDTVENAIRALLGGPTPEEVAGQIATVIPDGVGLLSTEVADGVGSINLSREFERSAEQSVLILRIGQVVYTATEIDGVERVRFLIDGDPVDVLAEDGSVRADPVGRAEYQSLAVAP